MNACFSMCLDFRASNDWLFSSRWIPPRYFRYQSQSLGTKDSEAVAFAAHNLHVKSPYDEKSMMTSHQYRKEFKRLVTVTN